MWIRQHFSCWQRGRRSSSRRCRGDRHGDAVGVAVVRASHRGTGRPPIAPGGRCGEGRLCDCLAANSRASHSCCGADRSLGDAAPGGGVCVAVTSPVSWCFDCRRPIQRQSHLSKPPTGGAFVDFLGRIERLFRGPLRPLLIVNGWRTLEPQLTRPTWDNGTYGESTLKATARGNCAGKRTCAPAHRSRPLGKRTLRPGGVREEPES